MNKHEKIEHFKELLLTITSKDCQPKIVINFYKDLSLLYKEHCPNPYLIYQNFSSLEHFKSTFNELVRNTLLKIDSKEFNFEFQFKTDYLKLFELLSSENYIINFNFDVKFYTLTLTKSIKVKLSRAFSDNAYFTILDAPPTYKHEYVRSRVSINYNCLPALSTAPLFVEYDDDPEYSSIYLATDYKKRAVADIVNKRKDIYEAAITYFNDNLYYPITIKEEQHKGAKIAVIELELKCGKISHKLDVNCNFINAFKNNDKIETILKATLLENSINEEFPEEVISLANSFGDIVPNFDPRERVDLRHLDFVTIDGEDAKDFDDAIYVEQTDDGSFKLFVAIADVSYYVRPNDPIDKEAQLRTTSIYLPTKVIPMLPESLSNGICSIKPDLERFVLVVEFEYNSGTNWKGTIYPACIISKRRFTYTEVQSYFDTGTLDQSSKNLAPMLDDARKLYLNFLNDRIKRGSLEFDSKESVFKFEADGSISELNFYSRVDAHKLIEEFMICANFFIATAYENYCTMPHRNHEEPSIDKIESLLKLLTSFGIHIDIDDKFNFREVLDKVSKELQFHSYKEFLTKSTIRCMTRAMYGSKSIGHFGLALSKYSQFTSPIRRYPDLLLHRAVKSVIFNEDSYLSNGGYRYSVEEMDKLCNLCNETELKVDNLYYKVLDWLKALYLESHKHEVFQAVITFVGSNVVFVEILELGIEGVIQQPERKYQNGQLINVKVQSINLTNSKSKIILKPVK